MRVVLDASMALTWLLHDASEHDTGQAFDVLTRFEQRALDAVVPAIWSLELSSAILRAEKEGRTGPDLTEDFLNLLAGMQIAADSPSAQHVFEEILPLATLATLDTDLRRAARKAGVQVFKP